MYETDPLKELINIIHINKNVSIFLVIYHLRISYLSALHLE